MGLSLDNYHRCKYRFLLGFLQDSKGNGVYAGVEVNSKFLSLFFLSLHTASIGDAMIQTSGHRYTK